MEAEAEDLADQYSRCVGIVQLTKETVVTGASMTPDGEHYNTPIHIDVMHVQS